MTLWINLWISVFEPLKSTLYFIRQHFCDIWGHPPGVVSWRMNWRMLADGQNCQYPKVNKINNLASANMLADDWRMSSGDRSSANPPHLYKCGG